MGLVPEERAFAALDTLKYAVMLKPIERGPEALGFKNVTVHRAGEMSARLQYPHEFIEGFGADMSKRESS